MLGSSEKNPHGIAFEPVPWDSISGAKKKQLPFFARRRVHPVPFFIIAVIFSCILNLLVPAPAVAALTAGVLGTIMWSQYRGWILSGSWDIEGVKFSTKVKLGDVALLKFIVKSKGPHEIQRILIRSFYVGSRDPEHIEVIEKLQPGEIRNVEIKLYCDRTKGTFPIGDLQVVVSDPLGFYSFCNRKKMSGEIQVTSDRHAPIERFKTFQRGLALHTGTYENKMAGDSISFLGLREYRRGDPLHRIDWKRSQKCPEFLVKEFEQVTSTDVTLFFDQYFLGHSEFDGISSLEDMRDAAQSITHYVLDRQMRMQFVSVDQFLPLRQGQSQKDMIEKTVPNLGINRKTSIDQLIKKYLPIIPSDSVAIILYGTKSVSFENLWKSIVALDSHRVDVILVAFDSEKYASRIGAEANVDALATFYGDVLDSSKQVREKNLMRRLATRTYMVEPDRPLHKVCAEKS